MAIANPIQPITVDDAKIRAALDDAFLPALIPALAQATGDMSLLRDDLRPPGVAPGVLQGGMTEAQQTAAKELAFHAVKALRDQPFTPSTRPIEEDLRAITNWMTGKPAADEYIQLLVEELAPGDEDPRAPQWRMPSGVAFHVTVIGAGMSGILAGIRLKQAGVPFTIIEKNTDVGGTWFENTYPGARVDVSNAFYSYSFAQKIDWPKYFSPQGVLLDYFRDCADQFGLREHIRFNTEVLSANYDEASAQWSLKIRTADGREETVESNAIVSAVGQLNRPKLPDIKGMDTFAGPAFHSARWDHSVDLKGKRVAFIGNGASAAQSIPLVANDAAELYVFQRTPNWFFPAPTYHDDVPEGLQWLFGHVPHYAHWYRFWLFWNSADGLLPAATVDTSWPHQDRSVSEMNDQIRMLLEMYLRSQYTDRPDLLEKMLPSYPPTAKRVLIDNGAWAEAMRREHVHLVTDPIDHITPAGIVTKNGDAHDFDVIIYATGFQASRFLTPMALTGRGGVDINAQWDGDARAYMGITVPNFPNFFMLYGPNTNIVVNGSIIFFSECEVQYVMGCLKMLFDGGHHALDCKPDVHDAYNERIDALNKLRTWGASTVNSWYKNDKGRSAQNWPGNLIEYWQQTREPNPADYVIT